MIPIAEPVIAKNAKKYIDQVLKSGWVSSKGPFVTKFESAFAKFAGTKYSVATSSGTSAIHLALASLNIGKDDEVIVPALTMIAAAIPIIYLGAKPVLVDSNPDGNIDSRLLKDVITPKTKAIIVVHLNGIPAEMKNILDIAEMHGIPVIEDAAESQGAKYMLNGKWKMVGSMGEIGCFSFYGNKMITTGEGGIAVTNDRKLAQKMKNLRNLDRTRGHHFYHKSIAFTYRMSSLQAALGLAQLEQIQKFGKIKMKLAAIYNDNLNGLSELETFNTENAGRIYWNYDVLFKNKKTRNIVANKLREKGIETRNLVVPMHLQPAFKKMGLFQNEKYPVAEKISRQGLSLPLGLTLSAKQIIFICDSIKSSLK